jgi:quercetin dioxygenase-like cupin family protein
MQQDELRQVGPIGFRRFVLEKTCNESEGHEHNYDHATIVVRGRIRVAYSYLNREGKEVKGETQEFCQGEVIEIKAKVRHTIKALDDNTVYLCVFSHRDFDGLVTQSYVGNTAAYV